jgi:hypothetical protein
MSETRVDMAEQVMTLNDGPKESEKGGRLLRAPVPS